MASLPASAADALAALYRSSALAALSLVIVSIAVNLIGLFGGFTMFSPFMNIFRPTPSPPPLT
jgi:hypothetical protein